MQEYWWPGWPFTGVKERDRNTAWAKGQVKKKKKLEPSEITDALLPNQNFMLLSQRVFFQILAQSVKHIFCLTAILTWSTSENNASRKKDSKHPFCQIFQYPLFFTTMAEGKRRKFSKLAIHHLQLLRAAHFSKCWRRLLSFCFCK